jgi:electron transfer flavoprotein alpha subunit
MRIAVLVKQVPAPAQLAMAGGRLRRDGVDLEVNAYCRRANAMAVGLAGPAGEVVVLTMGPPSAEDALREMLACGADRAVHLCDPAFAGADTLATARALAAAVRREGPFDLVLCGASSIDADTGQVGPSLAALLGVPFAGPARELAIDDGLVTARLESEDGYRTVELRLPAVVAAAERLCDPSKADPGARRDVAADRIACRTAFDLDLKRDEVGQAGSPTTVGPIRLVEAHRRRRRATSADEAVRWLLAWGALDRDRRDAGAGRPCSVVKEREGPSHSPGAARPVGTERGTASTRGVTVRAPGDEMVAATGGPGPEVWCVLPGDAPAGHAELVGEAARLAAAVGGSVTVVVPEPVPVEPGLGALGADRVLVVDGDEPEDWAPPIAVHAARERPWAVLVQGTAAGRSIAPSVAARNGWGLVGDAVGFDLAGDRLVAWKPAFGGQCVAAVESSSPVRMATVRPGVLPRRWPRPGVADPPVRHLPSPPGSPPGSAQGRVRTISREHLDDGALDIRTAAAVVGVGRGVDPGDYPQLDRLRQVLGGAPLAATRKVTDRGWLPRSRQVGVTGRAIAPRLYVAIGVSGRFNHMVGVAGAGTVLAVDVDPEAPVFDLADAGLVGDWREIVPALAEAIAGATAPNGAAALPLLVEVER